MQEIVAIHINDLIKELRINGYKETGYSWNYEVNFEDDTFKGVLELKYEKKI